MKLRFDFSFLRSTENDPRGSGKSSSFHAPSKPGELQNLTTGVRSAPEPQSDPALSLLETLQAVKEKQQSGTTGSPQSQDKNLDDISGVQSEMSALQRLMSTQVVVLGSASLILVLSIWGLLHLARRAAETVPNEAIEVRNRNATETVGEGSTPVAPVAPEAPRPTEQTSAGVARPAPRTPPPATQNAALLQAERERLIREEREREQREKQREEEDNQERERQLRELEGRDQGGEPPNEQPATNGAEVAAPAPEDAPVPPTSD
jgi:type IV secretory pathway VirB10-like protein